jgi:hypothetical protein
MGKHQKLKIARQQQKISKKGKHHHLRRLFLPLKFGNHPKNQAPQTSR